ncbi:MAG: hypothetical protein JNM00_15660, partial [Flavobacteriales bacterium]|nr:hypothetical protein [Flavobacteriales bacterium]
MRTTLLSMLNLRNLLESRRTEGDDDRLPVFFHLSKEVDAAALRKLLTDAPDISIVDQLESQLRDLVKLRHPERKLSETEYTTLIQSHIGDTPFVEYGVWVYYPWRKMLVHLLDESEFVEVRTIRNRYKITAEEQAQLASKKIGVIGLSVGQSVSLA